MRVQLYAIVNKSVGMVMPNNSAPWLDLNQKEYRGTSVPHLLRSRQEADNLIKMLGEAQSEVMVVVPVHIEIDTATVYGEGADG